MLIDGLTIHAANQTLVSSESLDGNIECNLPPSKVGKPICNSY
jgi:hypothetical protein